MLQKIKSYIAGFITSNHIYKNLLSGSLIIFTSSVLVNGFSFLFNLATARNLSVENYGILQTMLSLFYMLTTLTALVSIQLTKQLSKYTSRKNYSSASALVNKSNLFVIIVGVVSLSSFMIISNIGDISIGSVTSGNLFIVILLTTLGYLLSINKSLMRANLLFSALALNSIFQAVSKLIIFFPLLFLGFNLNGAIWSLFISGILTFLYSIWQLRDRLFINPFEKINFSVKTFTKESVYAIVGITGLISLISVDLILVQHYLTDLAGYYAALTLSGKAILLTTAPLSIVLFPTIINAKSNVVGKKLFKIAILGVFVLGSSVFLLYLLIPKQLVSFALSPTYYTIIPLLPHYSLSILFYTVSNIIVNGFIALDEFIPGYLAFFAAVLQIIGIFYLHDSLNNIVMISLFINIGLTSCLIFFTLIKLSKITKRYYYSKALSDFTP
ncbi:MAG: oligosaccharide flippase family protein [Candidatus Levybacteria bacterium]|nr:oligosaccharide flippase family protein [Candidatus Levybacteria bacterium]